MKFSSVSRLLHTGRHTGSTGTRGLYSLLMLGTLATGLHTGWGLHLELQQQRPHHAGLVTSSVQENLVPRQCPLYPVSSSTSRCSGGRCGVLRSIHYTLIGMQAAGAGPAPAGHTAPTIPSSQPQTSFPFYMLCPLPLVSSSGAQGREKRWFILLSIAIETIFQYPWYMVDIRL